MLFEIVGKCMRLLQIARRPTSKEYRQIVKITGAGIVFVGFVGMVMFLVFSVI